MCNTVAHTTLTCTHLPLEDYIMNFADSMFDLAHYCELRGYDSFATVLLECAAADSLLPLEDASILCLPDWLLRLVHRIGATCEYIETTMQTWFMQVVTSFTFEGLMKTALPEELIPTEACYYYLSLTDRREWYYDEPDTY